MCRIKSQLIIIWLFISGIVGGCCSLPPNTPVLLDKTAERIETRSEVITTTLRTVLDESMFAMGDVEEVLKSLQKIDKAPLSDEDKKALASATSVLKQLQETLSKTKDFAKVPDDSKRIFQESVRTIKLVRQMIAFEVDKKALVQDMIDALEKTKNTEEAK